MTRYEIPPEVYDWWLRDFNLRQSYPYVDKGNPFHPATNKSIVDLYNEIVQPVPLLKLSKATINAPPLTFKKSLDIAFILYGVGYCGGVKAAYRMANDLIERGHRVTLYGAGEEFRYGCKALFVPDVSSMRYDHDAYLATYYLTAPVLHAMPVPPEKKFYLLQHWEAKWAGEENDVTNTYKLPLFKIAVSDWVKENTGADVVIHPTFYYEGFGSKGPKNLDVMFLRQDSWWKNPILGLAVCTELRGLDYKVAPVHHVSDSFLKDVYSRSRIFLFTSVMEGMPAPPLEAMLSGCVLVTTDMGGIREYADEDCAVFVKDDKDEIIKTIIALLEDDKAMSRLAIAGQQRALKFIKDIDDNSINKLEFLFKGGWMAFKEDCARNERLYPEWISPGTYREHACRYEWAREFCIEKSVLDVGCGCGYGSDILGAVALKVDGIEVAELPHKYATMKWSKFNVMFKQSSVFDYDPPFKYDTVVAFEVMEHTEDGKAFIEKCASFLKDFGTLLLSIPPKALSRSVYHKSEYTVDEIRELLKPEFYIEKEYVQYPDNQLTYIPPAASYPERDDLPSYLFVARKVSDPND